jgi:hypothetical protein
MRIHSDGPRVTSTDYWSSEHALRGLMYLSINAGAARLLAPAGWPALEVMRYVEPLRASLQIVGAHALGVGHIVIEDGGSTPPYLTLDARMIDRALPKINIARGIRLMVYQQAHDDPEGVCLLDNLPALLERAEREPR